jgi:hypothetical protein
VLTDHELLDGQDASELDDELEGDGAVEGEALQDDQRLEGDEELDDDDLDGEEQLDEDAGPTDAEAPAGHEEGLDGDEVAEGEVPDDEALEDEAYREALAYEAAADEDEDDGLEQRDERLRATLEQHSRRTTPVQRHC